MATISISDLPGLDLYAVLRDATDQVYNTSSEAFEAYNSSNWASYDIAATEQGSSGYYVAATPAGLTAGRYRITFHEGASPAEGDAVVDSVSAYWDGTDWWPLPAPDNTGIAAAQAAAETVSALVTAGAFTEEALANAPTSEATLDPETLAKIDSIHTQAQLITAEGVTALALSSLTVGAAPVVDVVVYQGAAIGPLSFTQEASVAGKSLALVVSRPGSKVALFGFTSAAGQLSVDSGLPTVVVLEADDSTTGTSGRYGYALWNLTDDQVLQEGAWTVKAAPTPATTTTTSV
ncbi:MAG: hypothetical protein ACOY3P_06955 [Planctomycetota bacterium]